jgi:putative glutamine amidotransferase
MKAIIGINVDISGTQPKIATVQANYYESVARAGGIPVLIPPCSDDDLAELLQRIDGLMFIGGYDYCPSVYGEERHPSVELAHGDRIDFDYRLLQRSLDNQRLPVLGICAGAQILNIGLGGNLHQDILADFPDTHVQHSSPNGWVNGFHNHKVIVKENTKLGTIYSRKEFDVPTSHHQAVKKLGKGLVATATAEDGIIEAVELPDRNFVIGVQWHPERDYAGNEELFSAFVQASLANSETSKRR